MVTWPNHFQESRQNICRIYIKLCLLNSCQLVLFIAMKFWVSTKSHYSYWQTRHWLDKITISSTLIFIKLSCYRMVISKMILKLAKKFSKLFNTFQNIFKIFQRLKVILPLKKYDSNRSQYKYLHKHSHRLHWTLNFLILCHDSVTTKKSVQNQQNKRE